MKAKKIEENLFISGAIFQEDLPNLLDLGITAIVNLMPSRHYNPPPELAFLHEGFPDGTFIPMDTLDRILEFVVTQMEQGKVLVHCAAGISRSGGIIIGALLCKHPKWDWNDALEHVRQKRYVMPAFEIKESIFDYFRTRKGRNLGSLFH